MNTGFFHLRSSPSGRAFWDAVYDRFDAVLRLRSQQRLVNRVLADPLLNGGLRFALLPEERFANGHLFAVAGAPGLPPTPHVVHCSWTHDHAHKLAKYRDAGLWIADD